MQIQSVTAPVSISSAELSWQVMADDNCQTQGLPEELGNGCSRLYMLDEDFSLIETHYKPKRNLAVASQMHNIEPRMVLTLAIRGCSSFSDGRRNDVVFKAGISTLTAFNVCDGVRHYQGNQPVSQLRFSMSKHWLERHFGEGAFARVLNKKNMQVVGQRPISATALQASRCLLADELDAKALPLYRQGLAMAIVASELHELIDDAEIPSHRISQKDSQLAEAAREILQAEFANPPSVEELCRRVGTNQFKLKQLFWRYFETTPYGMVLDIRMDKAYRLLAAGRCTVGLAAEAVGYGHISNFSAAFNKYFGFPPKRLCRQD